MEHIINLDKELFLFLNGLHVNWLDPIMIFISGTASWIPFYAVLLFLVFYKYRWKGLIVIAGVILLVICSDQISAHVFKPVFQRPRPCHEEDIKDLVYLPNGHCGGAYGFISSHACNVFAFAVFITSFFKPYYKNIAWLMFTWAVIIAYSRIYMGVHYPGDVIAGALTGLLIGWCVTLLVKIIMKKLYKNTSET